MTKNYIIGFMSAVKEGDIPKIQQYVDQHKIDVNVLDVDKSSALEYATIGGNIETARFLIDDLGADINRVAGAPYHSTVLGIAVRHGNIEMMQCLIQSGANINGADNTRSPLEAAAMINSISSIDYLLNAGADINKTGHKSALSTALEFGKEESALHLINNGAVANNNDLKVVAQKGYAQCVPLLVAQGLDPNAEFDISKNRPINLAAHKGHIDTVVALLDVGAEVTSADFFNAVLKYNKQIVQKFTENISDQDLSEVLRIAAKEDKIEAIQVLMINGVNPDDRDTAGKTAKDYASELGKKEIVNQQYLLDLAACYVKSNATRQSVHEIAQELSDSPDRLSILARRDAIPKLAEEILQKKSLITEQIASQGLLKQNFVADSEILEKFDFINEMTLAERSMLSELTLNKITSSQELPSLGDLSFSRAVPNVVFIPQEAQSIVPQQEITPYK